MTLKWIGTYQVQMSPQPVFRLPWKLVNSFSSSSDIFVEDESLVQKVQQRGGEKCPQNHGNRNQHVDQC